VDCTERSNGQPSPATTATVGARQRLGRFTGWTSVRRRHPPPPTQDPWTVVAGRGTNPVCAISTEPTMDNKRKPRPSGRWLIDRHSNETEGLRLSGIGCKFRLNGEKLAVGLGSAARESEDSKSEPVPFEPVHRGRKDRQADGTARASSSGNREGGRPCTPSRENGTHAASGYPTLPQPHTGPKSCARTETPRRLRRRVEVAPVGRAWATTTLAEVIYVSDPDRADGESPPTSGRGDVKTRSAVPVVRR